MSNIGSAMASVGRLRTLPPLARDLGASLAVLAAFGAAAALPPITVPAAALVVVPVLLFTAFAFKRDSALLAALLAALVARLQPFGPGEGSGSVGLLTVAVLSGAALAVASLLEELRRSRAEAATAYLRSDATARRAAERVEAARRELREAKARLAEADRNARQAAAAVQAPPRATPAAVRTSGPDPALESAFRSEGGV